jgi:hypothetical protein
MAFSDSPKGQNIKSHPTGNQWILVSSANALALEGIMKYTRREKTGMKNGVHW